MENKKQKNSVAGWQRVSKTTGERFIYLKVTIDGVEKVFSLGKNKFKKTEKQPDYFGLEIIDYNKQQQTYQENDDIGF